MSINMVSGKICLYCARITESHAIYVRQHRLSNFVISVFLDFKKAFDTVDHNILLLKLDFYGIREVSHEWLKSYLSERIQITVIDGITSSSSSISHGVPQWLVLFPLLFLLFINDPPSLYYLQMTVICLLRLLKKTLWNLY